MWKKKKKLEDFIVKDERSSTVKLQYTKLVAIKKTFIDSSEKLSANYLPCSSEESTLKTDSFCHNEVSLSRVDCTRYVLGASNKQSLVCSLPPSFLPHHLLLLLSSVTTSIAG